MTVVRTAEVVLWDLLGSQSMISGAHQIVGAIAPHVKSLTILDPANYWYARFIKSQAVFLTIRCRILPRPTLPASWFFNCFSRYFASGRSALRFALFAVAERRQKGA
jgi:hypothetical protein